VYEEIAVFQRFSRMVRKAYKKFVVMDTAPTGHTLLLIDATGAYHRKMARQLDKGKALITTTPMMTLRDANRPGCYWLWLRDVADRDRDHLRYCSQ
jgi:arsenite-transporting ATPase